jgi:ketosteroid isomerase-like protein
VELSALIVAHLRRRRVHDDLLDAAAEVGARLRMRLDRTRYWPAMSQANVEVVQAIFEALARRDRKAFDALARDHLAPHFTFESFTTGSTYQGAEGFRELIDDVQDTLDYVPEVEEAVDLGEHVLFVLRTSGRGSQSGVPVTQQIAGVWTFEEDRAIWGKSFASRAEALEAVGLRG